MLANQGWLSIGGWVTFALTSAALLLALRRAVLANQSRIARVGSLVGPLGMLLLAVAMIQRFQDSSTWVYLIGSMLLSITSLAIGIWRARYE